MAPRHDHRDPPMRTVEDIERAIADALRAQDLPRTADLLRALALRAPNRAKVLIARLERAANTNNDA